MRWHLRVHQLAEQRLQRLCRYLRGHQESAGDQHGLATYFVDPDDGWNSRDEHPVNSLSTYRRDAKKLKSTYTIPTTPVARREMVFPVSPSDWKMLGA